MADVLTTRTVEKEVARHGRRFDLFQFAHGKYATYESKKVSAFLALSDKEYEKIADDYRNEQLANYGW